MAIRVSSAKKLGIRGMIGKVVPVGLFLAILALFNAGLDTVDELGDVYADVTRAVYTFYATEGWYPPNIDVLKEHYGLDIDLDRFEVRYQPGAPDTRPEIVVLLRNWAITD